MKRIAVALVAVVVGGLCAWAGSRGGASAAGVPVLVWQVAAAFAIQWLVFLHSLATRSEKFFDLTGSLTYISVTALGLALTHGGSARRWVLAAVVIIWAVRLGSYLFTRVIRSGGDGRFDEILTNPARLFGVWTLQGLWVSLTALAAWIGLSNLSDKPMGVLGWIGVLVWAVGFGLEVVADTQKSRFRADQRNKGEFITSGLWSVSRHPNYLGEIVLWIGVLLIALPVLHGWQWIALISPLFVTLLLTRVSGIPMLEQRADKRWGDRADYQQYKANTPVLIPGVRAGKG